MLAILALWFLEFEKTPGGKNLPAITRPQLQELFAQLSHNPTAGPAQIAKEITRVLRRSEEARIYAWRTKHASGRPVVAGPILEEPVTVIYI
jgi:hypothetical protein